MPTIRWRGRTLDLRPADFVAQGGQASVYARADHAFKIFTDPGQVPHPDKLVALRRVGHRGIVAPEDDLWDPSGQRVGFSMRLLSDHRPLVQLFPPSYRQRNQLDSRGIGERIGELRGLVEHAHAAGALVVDLNELNVLVAPDHRSLALIDVDSWAIAGFPATALAESIRDRHSTDFSTDTDWFAFAIISFQLFTGIHPFRGRHPTVRSLDDRMSQNLSVFHPDVVVPPMADLDGMPGPWRDWYESLFVYGERGAPPSELKPAPRRPRALPGTTVEVHGLFTLAEPILGLASWEGRTWAWTASGLYEERRRIGPPPHPGFLPLRSPDGIAFVGPIDGGGLGIQHAAGAMHPTELQVGALVAHEGMLHGRAGESLVELQLHRFAGQLRLTQRVTSRLSARATRLYRGVAVTDVLGSVWVTRLGAGTAQQLRVPELVGHRVVDGVHSGGVTVLVSQAPGASEWTRHILGPDGLDSTPTPIPAAELIVLPTGVAIVRTPTGLELFAPARPGTRRVDVDLPTELVDLGGRPGFILDDTAYRLALRR